MPKPVDSNTVRNSKGQELFDDAAAARGEPRQLPQRGYRVHPAADLFPLLGGADLAALAADIRANGLLRPIVRWPSRGLLVDGRNREAACRLARVEPRYEEIEFADDGEAVRFVVSVNLRRRHLDESQRARVADRLATLTRGRPEENTAIAVLTQDQAADLLNVSSDSVQRARKVREQGAPALDAEVEAGRVSVSAAAAVSSLPKEEQEELVARGPAEIKAKAREIRQREGEVRRAERVEKLASISQGNAPLPLVGAARYPVIYADPPWRYDQHQDSTRGVNNHYPTMSIDDIRALPVGELATPMAALFLWATSPLLPDALSIMSDWGFEYRASWVWVKTSGSGNPTRGMGFWGRVAHEILLIGARGEMPPPPPAARPPSVFMAPRAMHSAKPFAVRQAIEAAYPELPKIELFARAAAPGWSAWGNQAPEAEEARDV